jgi:hypothetical protein
MQLSRLRIALYDMVFYGLDEELAGVLKDDFRQLAQILMNGSSSEEAKALLAGLAQDVERQFAPPGRKYNLKAAYAAYYEFLFEGGDKANPNANAPAAFYEAVMDLVTYVVNKEDPLTDDVKEKVNNHLEQEGFAWTV